MHDSVMIPPKTREMSRLTRKSDGLCVMIFTTMTDIHDRGRRRSRPEAWVPILRGQPVHGPRLEARSTARCDSPNTPPHTCTHVTTCQSLAVWDHGVSQLWQGHREDDTRRASESTLSSVITMMFPGLCLFMTRILVPSCPPGARAIGASRQVGTSRAAPLGPGVRSGVGRYARQM